MASSISTPILLVLAGVVGLLLGLLISTAFNRDSKGTGENLPPKNLTKDGYAEAARLWYSPATKKAVTQLDGDFYTDFLTLTPEQKKRALRILQAWTEWCGQTAPAPIQNAANAPALKTESAAAQDPITTMPILPTQELPRVLPSVVIPAVIVTPVVPEKSLSIVDQINNVLDEMVEGTPNKQRGIRLVEKGHEGVVVWVGMEHFNGVDAIPYTDVQLLIRSAVARWEEEAEQRTKLTAKP